jgi:surface polysaccharide O-acyltransferase-like enzyme
MKHRMDIEIIRVISAFAIVWFHSTLVGGEFAYAGLVVLLIVSIYLSAKAGADFPYLLKSSKRLLIPWTLWFFVYGLVNALMSRDVFPVEHGFLLGILAGSSVHLWFVPFLFLCLSVNLIIRKYVSGSACALAGGTLAAAFVAATPFWRSISLEAGAPIAQYVHILPGFFLGIFFGNFFEVKKRYAVFVLFLVCLAAVSAIPYEGVGATYLVSIVFSLCFASRLLVGLTSGRLDGISKCMFGVYFLHVALLNFFKKSSYLSGAALPLGVFFLSTVLVYAARRLSPRHAQYWS